MIWRAPVALVAALAVGAATGYAVAPQLVPTVVTGGAPEPVAAADPPLPAISTGGVVPDARIPPLDPALSDARELVGSTGLVIQVPVPAGMERDPEFRQPNSARWIPPGHPTGAYILRVALVGRIRTQKQMIASQKAALPLDPTRTAFEVLDETDNSLLTTFIGTPSRGSDSRRRRVSLFRWVSIDPAEPDFAHVEIGVTGRVVDADQLDEMAALVADNLVVVSTGA